MRAAVAIDEDRLGAAILQLLHAREAGASVCPSEIARAEARDWRPLMPAVRAAAQRLAKAGRVQATQGGQVVDALTARGPIRLRLPPGGRGEGDGA